MYGLSGRQWVLLSSIVKPEERLVALFGSFKAQLLANRNFDERALDVKLKDLLPPDSLPNVYGAVELTADAVKKGKRLVVFGDYDVDGITGTAILYHFLKRAGAKVLPVLPSRKKGYGLTPDLAKKLERYADLLITVDNGTTAVEELSSIKIPVVVLDHHNPKEDLPKALVVNPKLNHSAPKELKEISSAGLAFYLIALLNRELSLDVDVREYLWLSCMGTISDVMPLNQLNRIIVYKGIQLLNYYLKGNGDAEGIRLLMKSSGIKDRVSSRDVAFSLAPKLNAPGRVSRPYISLKLLLEKDKEKAERLLSTIERLNEQRKTLTQKALERALVQAQHQLEDSVIIVRLEEWAGGVGGIVAGRLASLFSKPAIVFSVGKEKASASVRGVEGMDVYSTLESLSHLFIKWGGHTSAVGLTIRTRELDLFEKLAKQAFSEVKIITPSLYIDMPLSLEEITPSLVQELNSLEPYGEGFPEPLFLSEPVYVQELEGDEKKLTLKVKGKKLTSWDMNLNRKLIQAQAKPRRLVYQIDRRYSGKFGILVDVED